MPSCPPEFRADDARQHARPGIGDFTYASARLSASARSKAERIAGLLGLPISRWKRSARGRISARQAWVMDRGGRHAGAPWASAHRGRRLADGGASARQRDDGTRRVSTARRGAAWRSPCCSRVDPRKGAAPIGGRAEKPVTSILLGRSDRSSGGRRAVRAGGAGPPRDDGPRRTDRGQPRKNAAQIDLLLPEIAQRPGVSFAEGELTGV